MKRLLPSPVETAVFITLAILLAGIAYTAPKTDLFMAMFAVPLFVTCAVMGMRRNPALAPIPQESQQTSKQPAAEQQVGA